ncbi:MAG: thiamine pyrophosphate-binding protein [Phycisphaerae bacterium]|nr:thiamine pyrophosphate-binding protein [Phycisphaerae bacterium]
MHPPSIGQYLIRQLYDHGVRHVFGVPGDYSLAFIEMLGEGGIRFINTIDEQGAGYAADAYARIGGLGAVCVTYAVGSLKIANTTAQAFAERSPVVVLCGAPGVTERARHPLLHHRVNQYDTQIRVFRELTVAATVLADPDIACWEIDRVLHAAERNKRPVYIELPRDRVHTPGRPGHQHVDSEEPTDAAALAEAVAEAVEMLNGARQPVVIAGEEIKRFDLSEEVTALAEAAGLPVAASFLGKSVVREDLPGFLGVYAGAISLPAVKEYVESADCCLLLGAMLTDMNLGIFTAQLDRSRMISADIDGVSIRHHHYDVRLPAFVAELRRAKIAPRRVAGPGAAAVQPFRAQRRVPVTSQRLFEAVNAFVRDDTVVIADVGDALFGAVELRIPRPGHFMSAAYYSSMGFAVPGAVGVQTFDRNLRPIALVGDGAFQMTGMEVSTAVRYGLSPIVIVLNNAGYATERFFLDGAFNDLQPWDYSRVPEIVGGGLASDVRTEDELFVALRGAEENRSGVTIVNVHLGQGDVSDNLARLGVGLGRRSRGAV